MGKTRTDTNGDGYPFQVGQRYRNRDGEYQVISIDDPHMVIRYEDGRTITSSIAQQARIWDNLQEGDGDEIEIDFP